jgi:hypothetical protein
MPTIGVASMVIDESLETEWLETIANAIELLAVVVIVAALWWLS